MSHEESKFIRLMALDMKMVEYGITEQQLKRVTLGEVVQNQSPDIDTQSPNSFRMTTDAISDGIEALQTLNSDRSAGIYATLQSNQTNQTKPKYSQS